MTEQLFRIRSFSDLLPNPHLSSALGIAIVSHKGSHGSGYFFAFIRHRLRSLFEQELVGPRPNSDKTSKFGLSLINPGPPWLLRVCLYNTRHKTLYINI